MKLKQVSLKGMLEITAGCGFLFALSPSRDLIVYGMAMAVLGLWSLRIVRWPVRWMMFNWLVALSALCFGMACLEHAFLGGEKGVEPARYWMWCGVALVAWAPLAGVNGLLFLIEALRREPRRRSHRLRRNADRLAAVGALPMEQTRDH